MTKQREPGWFGRMLAAGDFHRAARDAVSQNDMCRRLGLTEDAFIKARTRYVGKTGKPFPSFEELQAAPIPEPTLEVDIDVSDLADPPLPAIPVGHHVKGVSSLVGADGEVKAQWIKTSAQNDERHDWLEAIRNMAPDIPRSVPIVPPQHAREDLLAVYPVGDPHVGLLAWHRDAGENFDMEIAERNLVGAFQHLVGVAPDAAEALVIFIGDNTHVDSQGNTTTAGTRQDADGRTVKMADTIISIMRQTIALVLTKHDRVRLVIERGNHDELISAMLAIAMRLLYENEPRVTVDTSPEMYHWVRFGLNLIGTHHGDKAKSSSLLGVMACDRAEDWGQTRHRRWYCGHYHHLMTKEEPGMVVEYLPTLAGSDAWHRSMGYRSGRAMYMDVLHREWGHVDRHIIGIQQLRARAV